jgi:hypothetical protein
MTIAHPVAEPAGYRAVALQHPMEPRRLINRVILKLDDEIAWHSCSGSNIDSDPLRAQHDCITNKVTENLCKHSTCITTMHA